MCLIICLLSVNLELIHDLWVPNIYIYNLKSFKVIDVLSKLAGLWINNRKEIYYSQATHITFICPMLFDSFPLDTQVCKFQVSNGFFFARAPLGSRFSLLVPFIVGFGPFERYPLHSFVLFNPLFPLPYFSNSSCLITFSHAHLALPSCLC